MAIWRVKREWGSEGGAESSADVSGGRAFMLEPVGGGGEERQLSVQVAAGPSRVSQSEIQAAVRKYLDDPDPPRVVTLDREGPEIRTSPGDVAEGVPVEGDQRRRVLAR